MELDVLVSMVMERVRAALRQEKPTLVVCGAAEQSRLLEIQLAAGGHAPLVIPMDETYTPKPDDRMILATLSLADTAALWSGSCGTPLAKAATLALLAGCAVWAVTEGVSLLDQGARQTPYYTMLRRRLSELERCGLRLCPRAQLPQRLGAGALPGSTHRRRLLTQKEVVAAAERGERQLHLPGHTLITPLAAEAAQAQGIALYLDGEVTP